MRPDPETRLNRWPRVFVAPLWFWLGGMAGGAQVFGVLQDRLGAPHPQAARWGSTLAFTLVSAGALLLTLELARPLRLWRLLVTVRPASPLSIGAWTLTLFAGGSFGAALGAWGLLPPSVGAVLAWAAALLAFPLMGYTGLLLVGSARPIGSASVLPGPLFLTLGLLSGAALHALLAPITVPEAAVTSALRLLGAGACGLLLLWLWRLSRRRRGEPRLRLLTRGRLAPYLWGGLALGTALPALAPDPCAAPVAGLTLLGGFALRFALFNADLEKR